jgi:autotransporter-associated beta strand protein
MKRFISALIVGGLILVRSTITQAASAVWDLNPGSGDWNSAANWTPMTVPNGLPDIATFGLSNTTNVSISANTEVNGITFTSNATNPYTITSGPNLTLTLSGTGITNNSGMTQSFVLAADPAGSRGLVFFQNSASAGTRTLFTNTGAVVEFGSGHMLFFDTSSAAGATINNDGGTGDGAFGGMTLFFNASTAATATIRNSPGTISSAQGGSTLFFDTSTAANATITNDGGTLGLGNGGLTAFQDSSSAGKATITNNGAVGAWASVFGGTTEFSSNSTAANATIVNNPGTYGGGYTSFYTNSTAGNATVINNGGTADAPLGGRTFFYSDSTAANGMITNNSGSVNGGEGGNTFFSDNSSAAGATITNNGGMVSGADGGATAFRDTSGADSATLVANGGMQGGTGGGIFFQFNSSGGTSRIKVFGNGFLNIEIHDAPGVTVGSIEGDGNVFLGANNLTVGSNNLSTEFSGAIQDGGTLGGSLTKIGAGTLRLTGANTYTGGTNVNGGVLQVDGSIASNTLVNNGGTLGGTGTIYGNVSNNGTVIPGDGLGKLSVNGNYAQTSNGILLIDIAGTSTGQFSVLDVLGEASLNGTLYPVLLNGFVPTIGESFTFMDYGSLDGLFSHIQNQVFDNGTRQWSVTYQNSSASLTVESTTIADRGSTLWLLVFGLVGLLAYSQQLLHRQP